MTAAGQLPDAASAAQDPPAEADRCGHCGAPLGSDQEWCLECGAARTVVHSPPDWRIALGVIGLIIVAVVIAVAVVLADISGGPTTQPGAASSPQSVPTPAASAAASSSAPAATPAPATAAGASPSPSAPAPSPPAASFSGWPPGLGGWTVVLDRAFTHARAIAAATAFARRGVSVGVFSSSQHHNLRPGYWVVFSGRYRTAAQAETAANSLSARGLNGEAREVAPPAGQ